MAHNNPTNAPAASDFYSVPTPNNEAAHGQSSNSLVLAPASNSPADPGQSSSSRLNAPVPNFGIVPWHNSGNQIYAPAAHSEAFLSLPGPSSLQPVQGHTEATITTVVLCGQSSNNLIVAPASSSPADLRQSLSSRLNVPVRIFEIVPGQSSGNQNDPAASHSEAALALPGPSSLQPVEENTEPITETNLDTYDTDSDESVSSEEPEEVKEWRRKFAYYTEKLRETYGVESEETTQVTRTRQVDDATSNMSPQSKLEHHHNNIKSYFRKAMEEANLQGYVYGIVLQDDTVLTGSSETLRSWWNDTIKFEEFAPPAANKYYAENQVTIEPEDNDEPPKKTYDLLMQLSDGTMGALLSALMSKCHPPQRQFPFEKHVAPPWWPIGNESWWDETGVEREPGHPQYRKPHDLKKKWKAVIVISIIKHLAPNFGVLLRTVKLSKHLQDRLSVKEMKAWNSAVKEEMKIYSREHPDVPLSNLLKAFETHNAPPPGQSSSTTGHEAMDLQQQQQITPQQQQMQQMQEFPLMNQPGGYGMLPRPQMEMFPWSQQRRSLRFTCKNQGCPYHNIECGFETAILRDNHQIHCGYQNPMNQTAVPGELPMYAPSVPPFDSTSQVTVPPQQMFGPPLQPMHPPQQMAGSPLQVPQQMVGPPFQPVLHPQQQMIGLPFQQMYPQQQMVGPPFQQMHPPQHMFQPPLQPMPPPQQMVGPPFHVPQQMVGPPFQPMNPQQQMVGPSFQEIHPQQHMVGPPFQPMHSPQTMVRPPSHQALPPANNQIQEMYRSNTGMLPPEETWAAFNAGIPNYQTMSGSSLDMSQLGPDFNFDGFYNNPGGSSDGNTMGPYMQMLTDDQQMHDALPSMYQYPTDNFLYGGEGSSSGAFQQTGFQQFPPTEMQFFSNNPTTETGTGGVRTNIALPEGTQFGQIGPLDGSIVPPSQPSIELPINAIPEGSYVQQSGPPVMQNQPSAAELNLLGTDNSEPKPMTPFFQ